MNKVISREYVEKNYIHKDKIEKKIKELEREFDFYAGRCHHEWQDGEFDGEVCDEIAIKISTLKRILEETKDANK